MKKSSESNMNDLLQKWLKGDITRREERKLEESAKNDAFLADAMRGFREFPEQDYETKIDMLQNQLKEKYQKKERKIIPLYWTRVAAMLAFAIVAGGAFWFLNKSIENQPQEEIVMQDDLSPLQKQETPSIIPEDISTIEENLEEEVLSEAIVTKQSQEATKRKPLTKKDITKPKTKSTPTSTPQQSKKITAPPPPPIAYDADIAKNSANTEIGDLFGNNNKKKIINEENISLKEEHQKDIETAEIAAYETNDEISEEGSNAVTMPTKTMTAPAAPKVSASKELAMTSRSESPLSPSTIQGIVMDDTGEPLIGATILEQGTQNGTVTDFDGRFQMTLQTFPNVLDISYTGFMSEQISVQGNENELNIQLENGSIALEEVVIASMRSQEKERTTALINKASPQDGFSNFKKYVKKNIKRTEAAIENNIKGTVKIQFTVNADGRLSDFKIIESLGYGLDEEAIRLLKEGGRWKLPMEQSTATETYRFKFK